MPTGGNCTTQVCFAYLPFQFAETPEDSCFPGIADMGSAAAVGNYILAVVGKCTTAAEPVGYCSVGMGSAASIAVELVAMYYCRRVRSLGL